MTRTGFDADVIVVGLGPVGAVMATLLARAGLSVTAVEQGREIYPLPRAAHVDHEIMRTFQQLGIAEEIASSIRPAPAYEFRSASGETLMRLEPDPTDSLSGWAQSYMIHQPGIEQALRAALTRAGVAVRLGFAVSNVVQDADGVTVEVNRSAPLRAKYSASRQVPGRL